MRTLYELITDPGYHLFWNWRTDSQSEGIARASLSAAEIFDVQNVHDYYYSFPLGSTFSFPNVAPAFESMWFELPEGVDHRHFVIMCKKFLAGVVSMEDT